MAWYNTGKTAKYVCFQHREARKGSHWSGRIPVCPFCRVQMAEVTHSVRDMPSKADLKAWKEMEDRYYLNLREAAHVRYMDFIAPNRRHYRRRYPSF